jgi:hypothetical protein
MNSTDIARAVIAGQFTTDQLTTIADAVKFARAQLARQVANTLTPGAQVRFSGRGQSYQGTLESIKIKNAVVATPQGRFRVPMSMLVAV